MTTPCQIRGEEAFSQLKIIRRMLGHGGFWPPTGVDRRRQVSHQLQAIISRRKPRPASCFRFSRGSLRRVLTLLALYFWALFRCLRSSFLLIPPMANALCLTSPFPVCSSQEGSRGPSKISRRYAFRPSSGSTIVVLRLLARLGYRFLPEKKFALLPQMGDRLMRVRAAGN